MRYPEQVQGAIIVASPLGNEFFLTVAWIKSHIYQLKIPLLFLQGDADRISLPDGVRLFFEQVSWQDKQLIIYPQAYYELHNDLIFWLDKHLCD